MPLNSLTYVEINEKFIDNMQIIYGIFNVIVFKSRVNAYMPKVQRSETA